MSAEKQDRSMRFADDEGPRIVSRARDRKLAAAIDDLKAKVEERAKAFDPNQPRAADGTWTNGGGGGGRAAGVAYPKGTGTLREHANREAIQRVRDEEDEIRRNQNMAGQAERDRQFGVRGPLAHVIPPYASAATYNPREAVAEIRDRIDAIKEIARELKEGERNNKSTALRDAEWRMMSARAEADKIGLDQSAYAELEIMNEGHDAIREIENRNSENSFGLAKSSNERISDEPVTRGNAPEFANGAGLGLDGDGSNVSKVNETHGFIGDSEAVGRVLSGKLDPSTAREVGGDHISEAFIVKTEDGGKVFVKPAAGFTSNDYRDSFGIYHGSEIQRELAAQYVNEAMGGVIPMPAVAVRDDVDIGRGPEIALVQEFVDASKDPDLEMSLDNLDAYTGDKSPVADMAAFDFLIGNTDRHHGQGFIGSNGPIALDHSLAFASQDAQEFAESLSGYSGPNALAIQLADGAVVSDEMKAALDRLNNDETWKKVETRLKALSPPGKSEWERQVKSVRSRLEALINFGYRPPTRAGRWKKDDGSRYDPWAQSS